MHCSRGGLVVVGSGSLAISAKLAILTAGSGSRPDCIKNHRLESLEAGPMHAVTEISPEDEEEKPTEPSPNDGFVVAWQC